MGAFSFEPVERHEVSVPSASNVAGRARARSIKPRRLSRRPKGPTTGTRGCGGKPGAATMMRLHGARAPRHVALCISVSRPKKENKAVLKREGAALTCMCFTLPAILCQNLPCLPVPMLGAGRGLSTLPRRRPLTCGGSTNEARESSLCERTPESRSNVTCLLCAALAAGGVQPQGPSLGQRRRTRTHMRSACGRRCSGGSAPVQAPPARPRRRRGAPRTPLPAHATAGTVPVCKEVAPM